MRFRRLPINRFRNRKSDRVISGAKEYFVGAPRIAWSINISVNQVIGKSPVMGCMALNIAIVGNVIPENVKAITAYPPPSESASRIFDVIVVINSAIDWYARIKIMAPMLKKT